MSEKYEPDKRWRHRYEKVIDMIEGLDAEIWHLAALDQEATPAVWSEYAAEAAGCLAGAKQLLHTADDARRAHVNGEWPCKHTIERERER